MLDRRGINGARSTGKFSRIPRLPPTRETYEQRWEKTCHDWGNKWLSWKNKQTNNSKDLEIYVSKGRKESKKLENYRDVRPWSTLKLANFPIFFSASSSPGSLDLSIPFRELWVVREMRPTCAIKNTKEGEELQRYEILLRAVQDFSRDTLAKTGERNSVRFYAFPATGVIGTRGVKGSDHDHPLLHFSLRIFLFFFLWN